MKSDIDQLMQAAGLDALLILGPASHSAAMVYFSGVRHITWGFLLKQRGKSPVYIHHPMEREEAAATGLDTRKRFAKPSNTAGNRPRPSRAGV